MDLVDIDQVLDNLELTEAAEEQHHQSINNRNLKLQDSHSSNPNSSGKSVNNRRENCVSQVFTQLDDYQKNVKALETAVPKYDIDCPLPGSSNKNLDETPSTSPYLNTTSTPYGHARTSYDLDKHDDDEEEATNDINKFTEQANTIKESLDYDDEDSSGSLTTSSSSTFSSGPSAGAASTTDERASPISPISKNSEDTHLIPSSPQTDETQSETDDKESKPSRIKEEDAGEEESKVDVDDLATGVSSISISNTPSILPCETSASSVLHNVLNELSEPTSVLPLSHLHEEEGCEQPAANAENNSQSIVSITPSGAEEEERDLETHNMQDEDKESKPEGKTELELKGLNGIVPNVPYTSLPAIQQPITFGSTMDEISDTELDSMLQEMDIDADAEADISSSLKSSTNVNQPTAVSGTAPAVPNRDDHDDKKFHNDTRQQDSVVAVLVKDKDETEDDEALNQDSINADSFSQASTVEFSEIRSQNVVMTTTPEEANECENFRDNRLSADNEAEEDGSDSEGEQEDDDDDENAVPSSRPQRPTTLNLSTLKSSLHTNAGQTPPGNNASEDNNINIENEGVNGTTQEIAEATGYSDPNENLGRVPPIWVPDNMATGCMQCQIKFTMLKRRHHCRACGKVLCSVCCSQKFKLEFSHEPESRVCVQCYLILAQRHQMSSAAPNTSANALEQQNQSQQQVLSANTTPTQIRSPNPNNPMEYCSTIPPHRQVSGEIPPPPTVIVPVGVLKKDGSYSSNSSNSSGKQTRKRKSVMFSDGIAPGSDLAMMEQHQWVEAKHARRVQQSGLNKPPTPVKSESNTDAHTLGMVAQLFRGSIPPSSLSTNTSGTSSQSSAKVNGSPKKVAKLSDPNAARSRRLPPSGCDDVGCFIPQGSNNNLPPLYISTDETGCDYDYKEVSNDFELLLRLQHETLKFALTRNFFVYVKIQNLKCCLNRTVINFTTNGMHHVGNDEIIILLEYEPPSSKELMTESPLPKDIFLHLHEIYREAELGNPIAELSYTWPRQDPFLGSHEYGGFIFIRPTFQCLQDVILPENPFLIGILIHRSEVPWAKVFPLRLILRLGAQYRYYPCPHVSMRKRDSVYAEIAQTIINFLADFRNFSYTLPNIRGMYIHMEDRMTTVLIPRNRQEDVIKAMNNASDHILAFGGNFSKAADGHLVCMQNTSDERTEMYSYSTQAINIQGQPRKVTGASFFVLNESLKSTSGLLAKCSIVEDGLMVQILPSTMEEVRNALSSQKDIDIVCGPVNGDDQQREIVSLKWVDNDKDFNIGVQSPIDNKPLEGISSMRVHASFSYSNTNYSIRLTDIFILKFDDWYTTPQAALAASSADITRIAEQVARSASMALVPFLDLLVASGNSKIGLRVTLHQDNVCYEAGARGSKLPPLYMNALDNNLVPTLHNESTGIEDAIILELIFYILNV